LCKFLGKEVPDVPFPRINESKAIQETVQKFIRESYKRSFVSFAKKAFPVAVVGVAATIWWMSR
jgi:hypothetical protein